MSVTARCHRDLGVKIRAVHAYPVTDNVLNRDFTATKPNQVRLADRSDIPTGEGDLDLSIVEGLVSRLVAGWSMTASMESRCVVDALGMALAARCPVAGLLAHSDRGSQYAGAKSPGTASGEARAAAGTVLCNAPMESFFASLKKEFVHHEKYATRAGAKASLFECIEVFYNRERRHSALGYVAPAQFEGNEYS